MAYHLYSYWNWNACAILDILIQTHLNDGTIYFNELMIFKLYYEKYILSAQNDVKYACENIASSSEFLLVYKNKMHEFKYIYSSLISELNKKVD